VSVGLENTDKWDLETTITIRSQLRSHSPLALILSRKLVLVPPTPCRTPWGSPWGPPCIQDLLVLDTPLGRVLTEKGEVYACGSGECGQLGTGNEKDRLTPVKIIFPVGTNLIKEISAGGVHTVLDPLGRVLTEMGEVYACGWGRYGQLGTGDTQDRLTPVKITTFPAGVDPIKEISAGDFHTMLDPLGSPCIQDQKVLDTPLGRVLTEGGEVCVCGSGRNEQLGTGDTQIQMTPVKITLRLSTE
jgi:hypothetical protein